MTTPAHDADPAAPPECATVEERAADHAQALAQILTNMGYEFALVSVRKSVRGEDNIMFAPGGMAYRYSPSVVPVLRREASDLRRLADELDRAAKGSPDILGGHSQQVSETVDAADEVADTLPPEDPA